MNVIFQKVIFWKNKVQFLWHFSNSVILKTFFSFSNSSNSTMKSEAPVELANAYAVTDLETILPINYILTK